MFLIPSTLTLYASFQYSDFDAWQDKFSSKEVRDKIDSHLKKDKEIENYYLIDDHALYLFSSLDDKINQIPEFILTFGKGYEFKRKIPPLVNKKKPLEGVRIAIDPGHIGGKMARLEEKYIDMQACKQIENREDIQFDEGTLALSTAKLLRNELIKLGAEVILTRESNGQAVYEKDFDAWYSQDFANAVKILTSSIKDSDKKKEQQNWWLQSASLTEIFRSTYNFLDTKKRADIINAFQPHLAISIHYNLGGIYDQKTGKTPGTEDNYSLTFIPGAFRKGHLKDEAYRNESLKDQRSRYEFIRLIITTDIEDSQSLATIALEELNRHIQVPTLQKNFRYLSALCLKSAPGVYNRNLTLTRLVHAPVLYAEPLCQDNYDECLCLSSNDLLVEGQPAPKRIKEVGDAYFNTIVRWIEAKRATTSNLK